MLSTAKQFNIYCIFNKSTAVFYGFTLIDHNEKITSKNVQNSSAEVLTALSIILGCLWENMIFRVVDRMSIALAL